MYAILDEIVPFIINLAKIGGAIFLVIVVAVIYSRHKAKQK